MEQLDEAKKKLQELRLHGDSFVVQVQVYFYFYFFIFFFLKIVS